MDVSEFIGWLPMETPRSSLDTAPARAARRPGPLNDTESDSSPENLHAGLPTQPQMDRLPPPLQPWDRTSVLEQGRKLSFFGGCDYFRLSSHPALRRALQEGLDELAAISVCGSRKTTGNHPLYETLERALSAFFRFPSALLVANGYLTNLAVAQALAGEFTHALIDERAHASLLDAARFLDCPVLSFSHRDGMSAAKRARRCGPKARLIVLTDGLFAHSGEVAPIHEYLSLLPASCRFLVDDAHGAGVLGRHGRGTLEFLGVHSARVYQTITLSKAIGLSGGGVLGPASLRCRIISRSRLFTGHTPMPLPIAHAALAALRILDSDTGLRRRLFFKACYVRAALREAGWPVVETPGPIISLGLARKPAQAALCRKLRAAGIQPPLIQYPSGSTGRYFRLVISSEHTCEQLETLVGVLRRGPVRSAS